MFDGLTAAITDGTINVGAMAMLRLAVAVAAVPCESVTVAAKLEGPALVGLPEITPVLALRVNPAGRLPELMLQVYGASPPAAASVCEYAVLTLPPGRVAVVMASAG